MKFISYERKVTIKKTQKPLQDLEINAKRIAQTIIELMQRDIETREKLIQEDTLHDTYIRV
jgi:hypothetical protein